MEQILNYIVAFAFIWAIFGGLTIFIYLLTFGIKYDETAMISVFMLWFIFLIPIVFRGIFKLIKNLFKGTGRAFKQIFTKGESLK